MIILCIPKVNSNGTAESTLVLEELIAMSATHLGSLHVGAPAAHQLLCVVITRYVQGLQKVPFSREQVVPVMKTFSGKNRISLLCTMES